MKQVRQITIAYNYLLLGYITETRFVLNWFGLTQSYNIHPIDTLQKADFKVNIFERNRPTLFRRGESSFRIPRGCIGDTARGKLTPFCDHYQIAMHQMLWRPKRGRFNIYIWGWSKPRPRGLFQWRLHWNVCLSLVSSIHQFCSLNLTHLDCLETFVIAPGHFESIT